VRGCRPAGARPVFGRSRIARIRRGRRERREERALRYSGDD